MNDILNKEIINGELSMVNEESNSQFTTHNSQFKKTEVGVIPVDWEVKKLHNIGKFFKGRNIPRAELRTEGVSCVLYGEIYTKYNFVAYLLNSKTSFKIAKESFEIKKGDLLFAGSGETAEDIGKCFAYLGDEFSVAGGDIIVLRPQNIFNSCFLGYALNTSNSANQKYYMGQGSSVYHIYSSSLKNLQIPIPPTRTEQTAIATALSDMDALIEKLEQLIAKKRNIKQGAMSELLNGELSMVNEKDNSQFTTHNSSLLKKGWEVRKLGDMLDYEQPTKYLVSSTEYNPNSGVPVLTAGKSFILGYTNESNGVFRNLPVIIFDDFTTATQFVTFEFKVKSSALKILRTKSDKFNLVFMYATIQLIDFDATDHKRYWISEYQNIEVKIPKIEEQTRIAQILSDMDSEIEKLETQLSKYKMIKTGMMQELLTGEKRLI